MSANIFFLGIARLRIHEMLRIKQKVRNKIERVS